MLSHARSIIHHRFFMNTFDNILVKYGSSMIGFAIVALPIIGPRKSFKNSHF